MVQALKQLDQGETSSSVDAVTILDYLSYSVYQLGELERALDFTRRLLELGQSRRKKNKTSLSIAQTCFLTGSSRLIVACKTLRWEEEMEY